MGSRAELRTGQAEGVRSVTLRRNWSWSFKKTKVRFESSGEKRESFNAEELENDFSCWKVLEHMENKCSVPAAVWIGPDRDLGSTMARPPETSIPRMEICC